MRTYPRHCEDNGRRKWQLLQVLNTIYRKSPSNRCRDLDSVHQIVERARCSRLFLLVLVKYCSYTCLSLGGAIIFADEEAKPTTARETALELASTLLRPPRFHVWAFHCQITAFLSSVEACPTFLRNWSWGHMSPYHHSASFPRPAVLSVSMTLRGIQLLPPA